VNIDELHAHKTRGLIDVLETATGARRQPLVFKITTAGDDPVSPCGDEHDYACKVLDGILVDERTSRSSRTPTRRRLESAGHRGEGEPELRRVGESGGSRRQGHEGDLDAVGRGDLQAEALEPVGERDGAVLVGRRLAQRAERLDGSRPRG
jgi:hypothetical protein